MRDPREMNKKGKMERSWEPEPLELPLHIPMDQSRRPVEIDSDQEDTGAKSSIIVIDLL